MNPRIPARDGFDGDVASEPATSTVAIDSGFPALPLRSCCCASRPSITVIMPPLTVRPHSVDLHLCGHHYRLSEATLLACGALVIHRGLVLGDVA